MIRRALLLACVPAVVAAPVRGQSLRGRVVDEPSRSGLGGVSVAIEELDGSPIRSVTTDSAGFFLADLPGVGSFVVRVARYGFIDAHATVEIRGLDQTTMPALVMRPDIIALDSIEAIVSGSGRVGFSRSSHRRSGPRMAALERRGAWVETALQEIPGLRLRRGDRGSMCIESTRRMIGTGRRNPNDCHMVAVILDGMQLWDPWAWIQSMPISSLESIEYMTPTEAGFRYGFAASANGALVLWSRGKGPYVDPLRNVRDPD